jgi:hypothetical protein
MPGVVAIIQIPAEAQGKAMLNKKCFGAVLLAAAAVSSTAMAQDRGVNTAMGALVGAAIGGSAGGRDGAIVGGVLGAAVGNSVRTNDDYYYRNRSYAYGGYASNYGYANDYYQPAPAAVYVESSPRYYYQPRPVYVEPRVHYYDRGSYYDRGRGYDHGYDRGHDRGHDRGGWDHHR